HCTQHNQPHVNNPVKASLCLCVFWRWQLARCVGLVGMPIIANAASWHAWIVVEIVIIRGVSIHGSSGNSLTRWRYAGSLSDRIGCLLHDWSLPFLTLFLLRSK